MYNPQLSIMPYDPVYEKFSVRLNEDGTLKLRTDGKVTIRLSQYHDLRAKEIAACEFIADANEVQKTLEAFEKRCPKDLPRPGVSDSKAVQFLVNAVMFASRIMDKVKGTSLTIEDVKKHNQEQINFLKDLHHKMSSFTLDPPPSAPATAINLTGRIGCEPRL